MAQKDEEGTLPLPKLSPPPKMLIVAAPFYRKIADGLIAGAVATLEKVDATHEVIEVPGALEVPTAIAMAAQTGIWEGYVALGCVIRGETTHYETVCNDSSRGLTLLGIQQRLAVGNGILTCETLAQAKVRANPSGMDKGGGAAAAALHLVALSRRFRGMPGRDSAVPGDADILLAAGANQPRTA